MKVQFNLATVLIAMASISIWVSYFVQRSRNEHYVSRLPELRKIAGELDTANRSLLHIIDHVPRTPHEKRWSVFVPENSRFRLFVTTEGIAADMSSSWGDATENADAVVLSAGIHELELQSNHINSVEVLVDGRVELSPTLPDQWATDLRTGKIFNWDSRSIPKTEKAVLVNKRHLNVSPDEGLPVPGILLWIQREE